MKRKICALLAFVLIIGLLQVQINVFADSAETAGAVFYVSPDGDDTASGDINNPLATIQGARDKVREYKMNNGIPEGGITVYFREGKYKITETVHFTEDDSGTQENKITYKAYPGEKPVITGGSYIDGKDFELVTDEAVLSRFPLENAGKKIYQYNLKENGITEYGEIPVSSGVGRDTSPDGWGTKLLGMDVFIDDEAMHMARYPNKGTHGDEGWTYVGDVVQNGAATNWRTGQTPVWKYTDLRIENWKSYDDIHVYGRIGGTEFYHDNNRIRSVDTQNKTITLADFSERGAQKGKRYYYYNVLDELDVPGEFYIDRTNGILYLYPTKDLSNATVKLTGLLSQAMLECTNTSFVNFENLTIELGMGNGVRIVGGDSVRFSCCTFKNIGLNAALVGKNYAGTNHYWVALDLEGSMAKCYDNKANGVNHSFTSCEMFNLGRGGVDMKGGNWYHLENANFSVVNCEIHDYSLRNASYVNGINFTGRGFYVGYNKIYNACNHAMVGSGTGTIVEYNEMFDVCNAIYDGGAIYYNFAVPCHDTYFRYNYFHDIEWSNYSGGHTYWDGAICSRSGLYTDNDLFNPQVYGNVFENMPMGYQCNSKIEEVENNIFIDVEKAFYTRQDTAYLEGWKGSEALERSYTDSLHNLKQYVYFPYEYDFWREAYPEFYEKLDAWKALENSAQPMFEIKRNLFVFVNHPEWYAKNLPEHLLRYSTGDNYIYEDNIVTTEDPGFVDAENGNYQLKDDAVFYETLPDFEKLYLSNMTLMTEVVGAELEADPVTEELIAQRAEENTVKSNEAELMSEEECSQCQ